MMLGWEIERAGECAEAFLKGTARGQISDLVRMLKDYNRIARSAEKKAKKAS
jgi:hypothetical protein